MQNRDRLIDGEQMTVGWGGLGGRGIEQKGKRTHGHGQQRGDCWVKAGIRGLNGNGKNTIKKRRRHIKKRREK